MRRALPGPTIHLANEAAPSTPTFISVSAKVARCDAMAISLTATSARPAPIAAALTAQITGTAQCRTAQNASRVRWYGSPTLAIGPSARSMLRSLMSRPAQNARSPAPVRITTRTSGRSRKPENTCAISRYVERAKALTGGRSMVTSTMPSASAILSPAALMPPPNCPQDRLAAQEQPRLDSLPSSVNAFVDYTPLTADRPCLLPAAIDRRRRRPWCVQPTAGGTTYRAVRTAANGLVDRERPPGQPGVADEQANGLAATPSADDLAHDTDFALPISTVML